MAEAGETPSFRFLFREDQGVVTRAQWLRGLTALVIPLVLLGVGWRIVSPWANRGLDERKLIDVMALVTYVYLIAMAFALILIAVSFYNLSAKRLRARGLPTGLAGLAPFTAFIAGAAHWLQPRVADVFPFAIVVICDVAVIGVALWCLYELGVRSGDGSAS